jgi:hypothetical protein
MEKYMKVLKQSKSKRLLNRIESSNIAKIIKENGYSYSSPLEANSIYINNILNVKNNDYLLGTIKTKNYPEGINITPNTFYYAYYEPIWTNLSFAEKVLVIYWNVNYVAKSYGLPKIQLCIIPFKPELLSNSLSGISLNKEKMIYINPSIIADDYPYELITTIAHEMFHLKQFHILEGQNINKDDADKFIEQQELSNLSEFYKITNINLINKFNFNENILKDLEHRKEVEYAIYKTNIVEESAENVGIRTLIRYKKINDKTFGKDKEIDENTNFMLDFMINSQDYDKDGNIKPNGLYSCQKYVGDPKEINRISYCIFRNDSKLIAIINENTNLYNKLSKNDITPAEKKEILSQMDKNEEIANNLQKDYKILESNFINLIKNKKEKRNFDKSIYKNYNLSIEDDVHKKSKKGIRHEEINFIKKNFGKEV